MTSDADLDAIYEARIRPRLFRNATTQLAPSAVLLGGSPGSGKSRSAVVVRSLAQPQQLTPIIGDDLRPFHPDYERLLDVDPLAMPDATAAASGRWVEAAIRDAQEHRYPVLIEGTFRRSEVTIDTATSFRAHGFDVHLVALAVPDWESRLGVLDRYVSDHGADRAARFTSLDAHDRSYQAVPDTVDRAIATGVVDRVTILDRQGRTLHDSRPPSDVAALAALERGRHRLPVSGEREAHSGRLAAAMAYLQQTDQLDDRTFPLVDAIRRDREILTALDARRIADTDQARGAGSPPLRIDGRAHLRAVDPERDQGRDL